MVIGNSQATRSVSSSHARTVAESKNSADLFSSHGFHDRICGSVRRIETNGDRLIAPGIFEPVATVGQVGELNAELLRCRLKTPRLIAKFYGKEQEAFDGRLHL